MATILLVDVRETFSSELVQFLRSRQHIVNVFATARAALRVLRADHAAYDVIVLNMSHNEAREWKALEELRQFLQYSPATPPILCLSTAYWGPRMQLAIERKGARFVYLQ
jgi:CheY-like chemotaxis protein